MSSLVRDNNGNMVNKTDITEIPEDEKAFLSKVKRELGKLQKEIVKRRNDSKKFYNSMLAHADDLETRRQFIFQLLAMDKQGYVQRKQNLIFQKWYEMKRNNTMEGPLRIRQDSDTGVYYVSASIPLVGEWFDNDYYMIRNIRLSDY